MEYVEREDEFDIHPIEEIHKRRLDLEDEAVDVLTVDPGKSEFEDECFRMPVLLDIGNSDSEDEMVEVGPGTMRRRGPDEGKEWVNAAGSGEDKGGAKFSAATGTSKTQTKARIKR